MDSRLILTLFNFNFRIAPHLSNLSPSLFRLNLSSQWSPSPSQPDNSIQPNILRIGWVGNIIWIIQVVNSTNTKIWVGFEMSFNPTQLIYTPIFYNIDHVIEVETVRFGLVVKPNQSVYWLKKKKETNLRGSVSFQIWFW